MSFSSLCRLLDSAYFLFLLFLSHVSYNSSMKLTAKLVTIDRKQDKYSALMQNKDIVIDESMVPWRGRLTFRQYIPMKSHKYRIKLLKLCSIEGYTWSAKVYSGRDITERRMSLELYGTTKNICPIS